MLRTLNTAHDELIALGYLNAVEVTGRGQKTQLLYRFRQEGDPAPALVHQLLDSNLGLSMVVAQQMAREHAPHVEAGIRFVKDRQSAAASGAKAVTNPAGLLRSVLREPGRHLLDEMVYKGT